MKTVQVRPFYFGEERVIASIHNWAFAEWIKSLGIEYAYREVTPEDVSAWVKEDQTKNGTLWVAEVQGEVVGYAHCRLETIHGKTKFTQLLFVPTDPEMGQSKIAVIPPYRRLGVATALLQTAVEHFERAGADLAVVITYSDNHAAEWLLNRLSFSHNDFFYYRPYSAAQPWRYDTIFAELDLSKPAKSVRRNLDVNIREARERDAREVAEIFRKSAPWSPFGPNALVEQVRSAYLKNDHETVLVAEFQGKVVGVMDFNGTNSRLGIPGVLPEYQNKGIGYTLFAHILDRMRHQNCSKAIADTELIRSDAIKMYNWFGFTMVRRQHAWIKQLSRPRN